MLIDMHSHTVASDDSKSTAEQYMKWILHLREYGYQIDGVVFTEHRQFDFNIDYQELSSRYGVMILKAAELDTDIGHMLVYGVNRDLSGKFDFTDVHMDGLSLLKYAKSVGAIAVPAHPGRKRIGLFDHDYSGRISEELEVLEVLNGGSVAEENHKAFQMMLGHDWKGIGGSDAHLTSAIGRCLTQFDAGVKNERDLVIQLRTGNYHAVKISETIGMKEQIGEAASD